MFLCVCITIIRIRFMFTVYLATVILTGGRRKSLRLLIKRILERNQTKRFSLHAPVAQLVLYDDKQGHGNDLEGTRILKQGQLSNFHVVSLDKHIMDMA